MNEPVCLTSHSWINLFTDRCQRFVGTVQRAEPHELVGALGQLTTDLPLQLLPRERLVIYNVLTRVLGRTALLTGISRLPDVSTALVSWSAVDFMAESFVTEIDCIMARCAAALDRGGHVMTRDSDPRVVRALIFIEEHFANESLTIKQVARAAGASIWHTQRLLKATTGHGFSAHRHRIRIETACRMLRGTRMSVKEVSAAVGYGSSSQFGRHFKRLIGATPGAYRLGGLS